MEINYEKSVGAYIRQLLEQRGLISLKKKELWEILGISKRHETFRKIIFEDYHTSDYSLYEELANSLEIDPQQLLLLAVINLAPEKISPNLAHIVTNLRQIDKYKKKIAEWTPKSLSEHTIALYEIANFSVQRDNSVGSVTIPFTFVKRELLGKTIHHAWIVHHNCSAAESSNKVKQVINDILNLQNELDDNAQRYQIIFTSGIQKPTMVLPKRTTLLNPNDLDNYVFKRSKYLQELFDEWYSLPESSHFVAPKCDIKYKLDGSSPNYDTDCIDCFYEWLNSNSPLLLVNGGFGTGKTTLLKYLATNMAEESLLKGTPLQPLLISLKDYQGNWAKLIDDSIHQFMREKFGLSSTPSRWLNYIKHGPFVVFLDALDEYSVGFSKDDYKHCIDQLKKIIGDTNGSKHKAKIVISFRYEMFPDDDAINELFGSISSDTWSMKLNLMKPETINSLIYNLLEHKTDKRTFNNNKKEIQKKIKKIQEVIDGHLLDGNKLDSNDLLNRPLISKLISENWSKLEEIYDDISAFTIHRIVVDSWIDHEAQKGRSNINKIIKRDWLYNLAQYLETSDNNIKLHYKDFPIEIINMLGVETHDEIDSIMEHEIRVASFLDRTPDGEYYFAYRSFSQYCFAECIADEIINDRRKHFGAISLSDHPDLLVVYFLKEISKNWEYKWIESLFKWLYESRKSTYIRLGRNKYTSANAFYLISLLKNGNLKDLDFSGIYLGDCNQFKSKYFKELNLTGSNFSGSYISRVNWENVNLTEVNFSLTWFHDCSIEISNNIKTALKFPVILTGTTEGQVFDKLLELNKKLGYKKSSEIVQEILPDEMFHLVGKKYEIGTDDNDYWYNAHSSPKLNIELDNLFISNNLVSNKQFYQFFQVTEKWKDISTIKKDTNAPYFLYHWDTTEGRPGQNTILDAPITHISYYAASDYCNYYGGRLLTEFEYEAGCKESQINENELKKRINKYRTWADLWIDYYEKIKNKTNLLSDGYLTLVREWCLDYYSIDHFHHIQFRTNPYTENIIPLINHSSVKNQKELAERYSREKNRVIRGFRSAEYTPVHHREAMEPTNVNSDCGFRVAKEVWIVLNEYLQNKINLNSRKR